MRGRTVMVAVACSIGLVLAGCSTTVEGSARLPANAGDHVASSPGGSGSDAGPGADTNSDADPGADGESGAAPTTPTIPTDVGDLESLLGSEGESMPTDLSDLGSLLGGADGAMPTDLSDLGALLGGADGAMPSGMPDLSSLLGGPCMQLGSVAISASMLLLGPSMGSTTLSQSDVDKVFDGVGEVPAEVEAALVQMRSVLNKAVNQPPDTVRQILDSDEFTAATDVIGDAMDSACGTS